MGIDAINTIGSIQSAAEIARKYGEMVYISLYANEATSRERLQNTRKVEAPRTQRVEPLELVTGENVDMLYGRTGRRGMLIKTGTNFNQVA